MPASCPAPVPLAPRLRTIALVGLMGVGKSTVGRRLAQRLDLPFQDGDHAIEDAAGMAVARAKGKLRGAEFIVAVPSSALLSAYFFLSSSILG